LGALLWRRQITGKNVSEAPIMKRATLVLAAAVGVAFVLPGRSRGDEWWYRWFGDPSQPSAQQVADDEKLLHGAKVATDGPGLLNYLVTLSPTSDDEVKVGALFKQLGTDNYKVREKASTDLTALGPKVIPLLKGFLPGATLEVRMRAERCIKMLEDKSPAMMSAAAVRLLKVRKPEGVVVALLRFAPHAADEAVAEEILDAVYTLGVRKGKLDPALVTALQDKSPTPRAIAAVLVARFGNEAQRKAARDLLDDKSAEVRFRAAQGLLASGERVMLPVLVDTLQNAPRSVAERAEDMLMQIADKSAPKETLGQNDASRKKCHEAWKEWLGKNQDKADLAKASIGFPLAGAEFRSREVAKQMIDLMLKANDPAAREKIVRLTDVPFYQVGQGQKTVNTRDEWEEMLKMIANQPMPEGLKYTVDIKSISHVADYLQNAKQEEKDILGKFSPAEVRIAMVQMSIEFMNQNFKVILPLYVRISGARGRLFGIGETKVDGLK
jgi:hypothetical protein